MHGRQSGLKT